MWHDPWLGRMPLIQVLGRDIISIAESQFGAPVNTFLFDNHWNVPPSNHILMIELRHLLSTVVVGHADEILWEDQKNIQITDIWQSIRTSHTHVPWHNLVWPNIKIPKSAFIMWFLLKQRLLTRDRMIRFGMPTSATCLLCSSSDESIQHLFFQCPYSVAIINHSPVQIPVDWKTNDLFLSVMNQETPKISLTKLFTALTAYSIWSERSTRLHENRQRSNSEVLSFIKQWMREKISLCDKFKRVITRNTSIISLLH